MSRSNRRAVISSVAAAAGALLTAAPVFGHAGGFSGQEAPGGGTSAAAAAATPPASPRAQCGPGDRREPGIQGRVPFGRSGSGFTCNTRLLAQQGKSGGFKVERFVDRAGRECAYYDTTLLFPINAVNLSDQPTGVTVLDMSNPAKPVRTASLATPAMQTPHESLVLNRQRGLLVAVMGNAAFYPGVVDVYDLNDDCRHPELQSSLPVGLLGHESGFAPDGRTFYATSLDTGQVTAVDLTNPKLPVPLWVGQYDSHGLTISNDGNRAYMAGLNGLIIVDVSEIQARKPNPQERVLSRLRWSTMTIPQVAHPVTIGGKPFLVEIDEFSTDGGGVVPAVNGSRVGAGRIIDIQDERNPRVVSDFRLAVNQPENRAQIEDDAGASSPAQGYASHYCNVPQRKEPGIVACSFIASGLRVFDIRDPYKPKELAYFVAPEGPSSTGGSPSNYAMSSPSFVPKRREIWYSDGNTGFYAVRVAKGVWPFATTSAKASRRIRLSVNPNRARVGRRKRFSFRATTIANGRRVAVRKATVRFDGRKARTNSKGRVRISGTLSRRRVYRARATRKGMRSGKASVRAVRGRAAQRVPRFTG